MAIWDNLKKSEVDTLVKFHNEHPERSVKRVNAQKIERIARARENENLRHNTACLYEWACEMMGIDPDNNPNYK